jgi:uncharacterized membrane protein YccC
MPIITIKLPEDILNKIDSEAKIANTSRAQHASNLIKTFMIKQDEEDSQFTKIHHILRESVESVNQVAHKIEREDAINTRVQTSLMNILELLDHFNSEAKQAEEEKKQMQEALKRALNQVEGSLEEVGNLREESRKALAEKNRLRAELDASTREINALK